MSEENKLQTKVIRLKQEYDGEKDIDVNFKISLGSLYDISFLSDKQCSALLNRMIAKLAPDDFCYEEHCDDAIAPFQGLDEDVYGVIVEAMDAAKIIHDAYQHRVTHETVHEFTQIFNNKNIRCLYYRDIIWFNAFDICSILCIENMNHAINTLDTDEYCCVSQQESLNRSQQDPNTIYLLDSGCYALIARSFNPGAKCFRNWISYTAIPRIRQKMNERLSSNANSPMQGNMMQLWRECASNITKIQNSIQVLATDNQQLHASNEYLMQYAPKGGYGEASKHNGLPRTRYRKASFVSKNGRLPKPLKITPNNRYNNLPTNEHPTSQLPSNNE